MLEASKPNWWLGHEQLNDSLPFLSFLTFIKRSILQKKLVKGFSKQKYKDIISNMSFRTLEKSYEKEISTGSLLHLALSRLSIHGQWVHDISCDRHNDGYVETCSVLSKYPL